jgi:cyclopropane fatty-acyl-phospholipid synthase-like methyltransferase
MRADYKRLAEVDVDRRYREGRARGKPGWADGGYEDIVSQLEGLLHEYGPHGGRMLEIGCGAGNIVLLAAQKGLFDEICGVDISEAAIAWAKEKAAESGLAVNFQVGNAVDLSDFPDACVDVVVAAGFLNWIIGDDRRDCLANVHRVLEKGGRCYVWTPCRSAKVVTERYYTEDDIYFDPESCLVMRHGLPYFHLKRPEEILVEITDVGLDVLHWELRDKVGDDAPYWGGTLLVVAAKPYGCQR